MVLGVEWGWIRNGKLFQYWRIFASAQSPTLGNLSEKWRKFIVTFLALRRKNSFRDKNCFI